MSATDGLYRWTILFEAEDANDAARQVYGELEINGTTGAMGQFHSVESERLEPVERAGDE